LQLIHQNELGIEAAIKTTRSSFIKGKNYTYILSLPLLKQNVPQHSKLPTKFYKQKKQMQAFSTPNWKIRMTQLWLKITPCHDVPLNGDRTGWEWENGAHHTAFFSASVQV